MYKYGDNTRPNRIDFLPKNASALDICRYKNFVNTNCVPDIFDDQNTNNCCTEIVDVDEPPYES